MRGGDAASPLVERRLSRAEAAGRGQVTLFFLIGLVVLIIFLILLLLFRSVDDRDATIATSGARFDQQLIEQYVHGCIDLVAEEGFTLLGQQGGLLYTTQGGATPFHDATPQRPALEWEILSLDAAGNPAGERVRVSFGLINESGFPFRPPTRADFLAHPANTPLWSFAPGDEEPWPWPATPLPGLGAALSNWDGLHTDGAYGQAALTKLCDPRGPNRFSPDSPHVPCPQRHFTRPVPLHGPSLQESLSSFLTYGLDRCIDEERLAQLLGATAESGQPNATVIFTDEGVDVEVELPLRFVSDDATFQPASFTRRYPVRLLALFPYATRLLHAAGHDPSFRINATADYRSLPGHDGYVVKMLRLAPAQTGGRDDLFLVSLTDPRSRVDQEPFDLQFLVQNRAPILDVISLLTTSPTEIRIIVAALDPDGDSLTVTFEGSQGSVAQNPCPASPALPPGTVCFHVVSTPPDPAVDYTVNISVTDPSGAADWQLVTVTVT